MFTQFDQNVRAGVVKAGNQRVLDASKRLQAMNTAFSAEPSSRHTAPVRTARSTRMTFRTAVMVAITLFTLWLSSEVAAAAAAILGGGGGGHFLLK